MLRVVSMCCTFGCFPNCKVHLLKGIATQIKKIHLVSLVKVTKTSFVQLLFSLQIHPPVIVQLCASVSERSPQSQIQKCPKLSGAPL